MPVTLALNELYDRLVDNPEQITLITVNRRAASDLRNRYDEWQKTQAKTAWRTLDVLPLRAWIHRTWQMGEYEAIVLTAFQEWALWQEIVQQSEIGELLLCADLTAQHVQQAWQLLQEWQIALSTLLEYATTPEAVAFGNWAKQFAHYCQSHHLLTTAELANRLITETNAFQSISTQIYFIGFHQITPQLAALCTALKKQNKCVEFLSFSPTAAQQQVVALADQRQEILTMARWAEQQWLAGKTRIACVIPNLAESRNQVERVFTEVFTPTSGLPEPSSALPFNISLGKSFYHYSVIQILFVTLKLTLEENTLANIRPLLLSTWIGDQGESGARALLDKKFHELGNREISLRNILAHCKKQGEIYYCPLFAARLEKLRLLIQKRPLIQSPSEWAVAITEFLNVAGWPGQQTFNSETFQILQRWQELLAEFSSLDLILEKISWQKAVKLLQQLADNTIFQPKTANKPIQLLGILEAAGLQFEALWMSSMSETVWPPQQPANPFISIALQRSLHIPNADREKSRQFYHDILQGFCSSASEIIFSYFTKQGDEILTLTPILQSLPQITLPDLKLPPFLSYEAWQATQYATEIVTLEENAPTLQTHENIQHGSHMIKQQAACPFQAFAKLRLGAQSIPTPESGLSAADRGALLHRILEALWNRLKDQQTLLQQSEEALHLLIRETIRHHISATVAKKPLLLKKNFSAIEEERLHKLIYQWLSYEKKRSYFKVIAQEQPLQLQLGNISFNLRVDRIDQLQDGTQVIIDYKTGKTNVNDWLTERPNEPQLPLYAIANNQPLSGLTFAQLRPNALYFNGVMQKSDTLPDTYLFTEFTKKLPIQNWDELNKYWRTHLTQLANDFCEGKANVDPKQGEMTCRYCDLKSLCRIKYPPQAAGYFPY